MTVFLPQAAYDAMKVQAKRTHHEPTLQEQYDELRVKLAVAERERDNALAEVKRLNAENDSLNLKAHRAHKVNADLTDGVGHVTGQFHDGIEYVNQVQAAAILKVGQYAISRWVKARKFEMIAVPDHKKLQIVRSSLVKPERGQPGRKKK